MNSQSIDIGRRARLLTVALCLLTVAGCSRNAGEVTASKEARPDTPAAEEDGNAGRPRVVALGDSLTAGLGLSEQQAYPALLQKKIDAAGYRFEVVNAGVSGDTSAGGLRRLDWALEGDVKILIVALGANDGLRGLSTGEMKKNLTQIIGRAKERQIVVILAGMEAPPNYGPEYTASFREVFQEVAREQDVRFIPFLLAGVAGESTLNQGDGVHPTAAGAAVMAETMWRVLKPALEQMSAS